MRRWLPVLLALVTGAAAQASPALRFAPAPRLAPRNGGIARIVAPATPAVRRINAANAALDAGWRRYMRQCRIDAADAEGHDATSRTVEVTLSTARFVAFRVETSASCGWMQPDEAVLALTYDLATGRPVDWVKRLPASMNAAAVKDDLIDGAVAGAVSAEALDALYLKAALEVVSRSEYLRADCPAVLRETRYAFQLWPDARAGAVMVMPVDVPHVSAACAPAVPLSTVELRRLGFDTGLLDAIDAAHAARP